MTIAVLAPANMQNFFASGGIAVSLQGCPEGYASQGASVFARPLK
jgi:hypothetical protein